MGDILRVFEVRIRCRFQADKTWLRDGKEMFELGGNFGLKQLQKGTLIARLPTTWHTEHLSSDGAPVWASAVDWLH